jgi:hypothetical protein
MAKDLDDAYAKQTQRSQRDVEGSVNGSVNDEQGSGWDQELSRKLGSTVHWVSFCLFLTALYALVQMLMMFDEVVVPFLVALFLMYLLDPLVRILVKPRDMAYYFPDLKERSRSGLGASPGPRRSPMPNLDAKKSPLLGNGERQKWGSDPLYGKGASSGGGASAGANGAAGLQSPSLTNVSIASAGGQKYVSHEEMLRKLREEHTEFYLDDTLPFYRQCRVPRAIAVIVALGVAIGFVVGLGEWAPSAVVDLDLY